MGHREELATVELLQMILRTLQDMLLPPGGEWENLIDQKVKNAVEAQKKLSTGKTREDVVEATKPATKCKKHPQYGAIRKPRSDCEACWEMYNVKHK
jgi:Zn finger protein HypA/HybF involved in hydrogenase expression